MTGESFLKIQRTERGGRGQGKRLRGRKYDYGLTTTKKYDYYQGVKTRVHPQSRYAAQRQFKEYLEDEGLPANEDRYIPQLAVFA